MSPLPPCRTIHCLESGETVAPEAFRASEGSSRLPVPPQTQAVILSEVAKPRNRRICGLLPAFLTLALASALLLLFPPTQYGFYPQCPVHHYLGILCPGCGTTRAFAALLRGHFAEALRLNALTTISFPLAIGWIAFSRKPLRWSQPPPAVLYAAFVIVTVFTLIRNL